RQACRGPRSGRGAGEQLLEDVEAELAADDGGDGKDLVGLVAQAREAAADDVAEAIREDGLVRLGFGADLVAAAFADDEAFFDEVTQDLLHEEGVALGLAVDELGLGPGDALAPDRLVHPVDLIDGEAAEEDAGQVARAAELGESSREGVGAVDLNVAVGADDEQPRALEVPGDVLEEVEGAAVGSV